ncbi:transmembrane channel-like protein 4 [Protopterus annectens]|uniref:transmembrane channel-like protein 4 n=1 Tax=Protopterus annectens TaxID=7888 RepID=UPI001CFC0B24|nr:transmembrane channel-like protein 4 [Protopterus annectens]
MTFKQREALVNWIQGETIVIRPADKGGLIAVMNSDWYSSKMEERLHDEKFYKQVRLFEVCKIIEAVKSSYGHVVQEATEEPGPISQEHCLVKWLVQSHTAGSSSFTSPDQERSNFNESYLERDHSVRYRGSTMAGRRFDDTPVSGDVEAGPGFNESQPDYHLSYRNGTTDLSRTMQFIDAEGENEAIDFSTWAEERLEEDSRPLKELALTIAEKQKIRIQRQQKVTVLSNWEIWKVNQRKSWKRFQLEARNILSRFVLWRGTLHKIEGHFGTGIQSYFTFLRFLVLLNLVTFFLMAIFVLIPNMVFDSLRNQTDVSSITVVGNESCSEYNPTPQGLVSFFNYLMDLLSGMGFMEMTYLFYGYYRNSVVDLESFEYNIPLAYLITTAFYFLLSVFWIVKRSVSGFRQSLVSEDSSLTNYSNKVFAGWDFCITEEKAVPLKQNIIRYELQMELEEEKMRKQMAERTISQQAVLYSIRVFLNLIVLTLLGASFYCIYLSTDYSQEVLSSDDAGVKGNFFLELFVAYLPSVTITAANFIMPTIFNFIIMLERYTLTTEIKLTLVRSVFLRLTSLGVLLFSLWSQITCDGKMDTSNTVNNSCRCGYNYEQYQCWETRIGQEMYKLIIFDFITVLLVTLLVEFPRKMLVQHCPCKLLQLWGQQEFIVPQNVLNIVYGQTVCWIGTFFSPLLPLLNTLKYFIIFYIKKLSLFSNCRPANRTFRASSSNFFFLLVLLLGLALACVPVLYGIIAIHPSEGCGPFRGQDRIWMTLPKAVKSLQNPIPREFLLFIGSQAFAVPLFFLTCLVVLLLALAKC